MKKTITGLICLFMLNAGFGQNQQPKLNAATYNPDVDSVAESLVALALNNPRIKTLENTAIASEYDYQRSKTLWLNNIIVSGNLNEFSIKGNNAAQQLRQNSQFPRYNFGVILPVGLFINNGKQSKSEYYKSQAAYQEINMEKQTIRKEVLSSYADYKMTRQLVIWQDELIRDDNELLKNDEERFRRGEISLQAYNDSNKKLINDNISKETLTRNLAVIDAQLESLIGMPVKEAFRQIKISGY